MRLSNPELMCLNPTQLIEYLLSSHHPYTKKALAELPPLLEKVRQVHGEPHPELIELSALFDQLRADLLQHLMKEEKILFPYILAMDSDNKPAAAHFGSVANPIAMMRHEHEMDGKILAEMQKLTDNFRLPDEACRSFTMLYQGLAALVSDLLQHIDLENNLLFVKAINLENRQANKL